MISNTHARGLSAAADFHCWCSHPGDGWWAPDSTAAARPQKRNLAHRRRRTRRVIARSQRRRSNLFLGRDCFAALAM